MQEQIAQAVRQLLGLPEKSRPDRRTGRYQGEGTPGRRPRVPVSERRWRRKNWSLVFALDKNDEPILPGRVMVPDRLRRPSEHGY